MPRVVGAVLVQVAGALVVLAECAFFRFLLVESSKTLAGFLPRGVILRLLSSGGAVDPHAREGGVDDAVPNLDDNLVSGYRTGILDGFGGYLKSAAQAVALALVAGRGIVGGVLG